MRFFSFVLAIVLSSLWSTPAVSQSSGSATLQEDSLPSGTDLVAASAYFKQNYPATYEIIWANPTPEIVKASQVEIARALIKVLGHPSVARTLAERLQVEFPEILASAMSQTKEEWLRSGKNPTIEVGRSVAEEAAVSAGAALATDLLFQTPPMRNTHPQLEGLLRIVVETTIVEMYDAQKALRDPSELLGKFLDRYFEIIEIYQSTVLLASDQKQALISAVLATETAAFAAADIGGMRGAEILRDALEYQKLAPISQAIGTDDEEAVNGILSVGLQALYAYHRGDRVLARQHAEKVRQLGNAGANIHPFSAITKPLDWAVAVINMGKDSPQIAAELFLGATSLADLYDFPPTVATSPLQVLYSSLGDAQTYEKYEELFPKNRVEKIVASVSPKPSSALSRKFILAASEVFGKDIEIANPVARYEDVMAFARGLSHEENVKILILSVLGQLASEHGLNVEDIQLLNNGRNINQSEIHSFIPKLGDIDGTPGWILRPTYESIFHAFGYDPADIRKYSHGAGCEYVFRRTNEGWEFLNDGVNTGTFNYSDGAIAHTLLDIFPWILWGVGAEERRSFEERLRLAQENGLTSQIVERIKAVFSKDSAAVPSGVENDECGSRPGEPDIVWRSDDPQSPDKPLDPNILFVEAISRYRDALSMGGEEQLAALADVRKRFDLIIEKFPETRQAQAIQGKSVPSIDFALLAVSEHAAAAPSFDIGVDAGLYAIDPALCSVADTVGDTWGALFQSVSASSVSRGYERDCGLISVSGAGETVLVSAECSAEGFTETETWTWRKTSNASFEEIEGRHSGKKYTLCASTNLPGAEAAAPPSAMTEKWGPSIVPDRSIQLGYRPCGDRTDLRNCLAEKGLSKEAIDFSFAVDSDAPGESFAYEFTELGDVDLTLVAFTGASEHYYPVLTNGPLDIYNIPVATNLKATFVDAASQELLQMRPNAEGWFGAVVAHRKLSDGTQRFVYSRTLTDACRACQMLGLSIEFLEIGPATGGVLKRRAIGLDSRPDGYEVTPDVVMTFAPALQSILNMRGYDAGPMDGYPGPQTRTALMEFQVEHCLPPTGQPDPTTVKALLDANGFEEPCAAEHPDEDVDPSQTVGLDISGAGSASPQGQVLCRSPGERWSGDRVIAEMSNTKVIGRVPSGRNWSMIFKDLGDGPTASTVINTGGMSREAITKIDSESLCQSYDGGKIFLCLKFQDCGDPGIKLVTLDETGMQNSQVLSIEKDEVVAQGQNDQSTNKAYFEGEVVADAVAVKPAIQFSDNSPATRNGQPMSVAVETYRDPRALAILTKDGLVDSSVLPNPPGLTPTNPPPTERYVSVLDRPTALAILRSEIFGAMYVGKVGSRTMRVREQDLSAFTEALITAIFSDDPRVREAQIEGLAPIREFGLSPDFDSNFVDQLRFGIDHGQRFIGLWQSGTASLPTQVWRIMDVGVPGYQPHPKLDPNGTRIAQIGVDDVSGIFVTGMTAEAQFSLKALENVRTTLAEAARLKLRTLSMIEYPSGGSRKTQQFDLTSENATWTAEFRLYDDGWRLWNIR